MLPLWNRWIAPTKIQNQRCLGAPKKLAETFAVPQDVQIREEMTKLTDGSGGTCKMRNETKRNEINRNEIQRNETKFTETKRNEINRNEIDRNETKRNNSK